MSKFFNYYNSLCVGANSPTVFSFDPYIVAVRHMFISELRQIVFYIQKLKDLSVNISEYRDKVIEFVSILLVNYDFNKESFFVILNDLYKNKDTLHELYVSTCNELNIQVDVLSYETPTLLERDEILKVLNDFENDTSIFNLKLTQHKKNLFDIIVNLILNACNYLIELKSFGVNYSEAKDEVLTLFNASNFMQADEKELVKKIKKFSKYNYLIMKELCDVLSAKYGPIEQVKVKNFQEIGNSILVSGCSFIELNKILELTLEKNINVYTHDNMISAFKYSYFRKFPNLVGHYQPSENNFSFDFSSFSGPIYISKNFIPKFDFIRGQIYTSSKYPSIGVAKIENNDFSPIINYSLSNCGFTKKDYFSTLIVGCDQLLLMKIVNEIYSKIMSKEIKHIVIVGLVDNNPSLHNYMNNLFKELPTDTYIISFSLDYERENFFFVNQYFDFTTLYLLVNLLSENIDNISNILCLFLPDCSSKILSHIFNFIYLGVKKIFLGPCCPSVVNPSLFETLENLFSVKQLSSPKEDILYLLI